MFVMINGVRQPGTEGRRRDAKRAARQTEFPLQVAVCAWCCPRELGDRLGAISHGICPRHYNQILHDIHPDFVLAALDATADLVRTPYRLVQAELAPLAAAN